MTTTIEQLSEQTINQIAAGEVVEDPSSVAKELIENAIDAGAQKVTVEISGGGQQRLQVSDDGHGMSKADALLSLKRHATSKIKQIDDLFSVATMGFRGEALASIASVAKVSLRTAKKDEVGTEVYVEGGKTESTSPCTRSPGTTVEVRQLFYNVPARRKFQKTQGQSAGKISKLCSTLSLAYPEVAFTLYNQEEKVLDLPAEEGDLISALKARGKRVLGAGVIEGALQINSSQGPLKIEGIITSCEQHRPNRQGQYLFVNKRAVTSPSIARAVRDAFGTRVPENRFPMFILHLTIESPFVDVNVHPQKKEIRLKDERWLCQEIQMQIQELLGMGRQKEETPLPFALFSEERFFTKPEYTFEKVEPVAHQEPVQEMLIEEIPFRPLGIYAHFLFVEGGSFLDGKEGLAFVDLKAAGARVLFDELSQESKASSQMLLLPITFSISEEEEKALELLEKEITHMGYSLTKSRGALLLDAIPAAFTEGEATLFLRDFLAEKGDSKEKQKRTLASSVAALVSRRKGHTVETGVALLQTLLKSPEKAYSPLGQKTIKVVGTDELQKLF